MNDFSGTWCLTDAPKQIGDLWIEITEDQQVIVMDPAGEYWRGREFATVEEFRKAVKKASAK